MSTLALLGRTQHLDARERAMEVVTASGVAVLSLVGVAGSVEVHFSMNARYG